MKKFFILVAIWIIGLSGSAWAAHNGDLETNTITNNSHTLGLDPTGHMSTFTQDGSGTVGTSDAATDYFPVGNPGAFTDNPFNIVCENADFGRGFIKFFDSGSGSTLVGSTCEPTNNVDPFFFEGGDPMTAPAFQGPNSAVGNIVVKVPVSLSSSGASGKLTLSGTIDFCLQLTTNTKICDNNPDPNADPNSAAQQGLAVVTQTFDQTLSVIDTTDPNNPVPDGMQRVIVSNTDPQTGGPITFRTVESNILDSNSPGPMKIPWSLSVTQDIPLSVTDTNGDGVADEIFELNIAGIYTYDGTSRHENGDNNVGLHDSLWPNEGTFDLPGFTMKDPTLPANTNNFPDVIVGRGTNPFIVP